MQKQPGEILKEAREKKGWTQTEMAGRLGITHRQYHKFEQGEFPKYKRTVIQQIDTLLGTSLYELIYEQKRQEYSAAEKPAQEANGMTNREIDPEFARFLIENDTWFKNQYAAFNQQVLANLTILQTQTRNLEALLKINLEHTGNIEAHQMGVKADEVHEQINRDILAAAGVRMDMPAHIPGKG